MAYAYTIELTAQEYLEASYMDARGYLGQVVTHASHEVWSDDGSIVALKFTESDAWKVQETIDEDPDAVWALSSPATPLGEKFEAFINRIV